MDKKYPTIKERILLFAKNQGLSYESFLAKVDLKYANFKGKQKLGGINSKSVEKIVSEFPDVNLHWLITGEYKITPNPQNSVRESSLEYESSYKDKYLQMLEENRALRIENKMLLEANET